MWSDELTKSSKRLLITSLAGGGEGGHKSLRLIINKLLTTDNFGLILDNNGRQLKQNLDLLKVTQLTNEGLKINQSD